MVHPIDEFETRGTDNMKCPFCGYVFEDSWEYGGADLIKCDCGQTFRVDIVYDVSYYTTPVDWLREWRINNRRVLMEKGMYSELWALGL